MDIYLIKASIMRMETRTPGEEEDLRVTAVKDKIKSMSAQEKEKRQIYATGAGCQVRFSSNNIGGSNYGHQRIDNYSIDSPSLSSGQGWRPESNSIGQWI